jgi:Holliday junction resolvasome RuvABC endonuclease subunit
VRILAIDPGTLCGWALSENGRVLADLSGVWNLAARRFEGGGMRYVRLRQHLQEIAAELIVYEEVHAHKGTDAAHIYGGMIATIAAYCEDRSVPYCAIPVGTIKKHATGFGNANKNLMLASAHSKWGGAVQDHNQADALWILDCYLATLPTRS